MLRYNYGTSRGKVDSNKSFLHVRHRTDLNRQWAVEALAQVGRDPFSRLSRRTLLGGGLRFTALEKAGVAAVYLGGGFYERERLSITAATNDTNSSLWRSSNYLVLKRRFNEQLRMNSITYYQPAFRQLKDYRLLEEVSAYVKVMDNIDLKLSLDFTYDARPPQSVKSTDLRYSSGLEMRFCFSCLSLAGWANGKGGRCIVQMLLPLSVLMGCNRCRINPGTCSGQTGLMLSDTVPD